MFRVALKSLLARKLRLLMSTFAIVLGVSFVSGTLVFSDTLERSFTSLFASAVGDVVVRPDGGTAADGSPSSRTLGPALVEKLAGAPGAARADGNVSATGVYVVDKDGKLVGGQGAPGIGTGYNTAPAGHGLTGLQVVEGRAPGTSGEVALDEAVVESTGYEIGDSVPMITAGEVPTLSAELVGVVGFPEGGSLNGATLATFDMETAQDLFVGGRDRFHDIWVTAEDGTSQEELRDAVEPLLPADVEALTGDEAADESGEALMEAISFIRTFLLVFAAIALVVGAFLIVNTFSILVAQRSRELALLRALGASRRQVTVSVVLEAFILGLVGSTAGLALGFGLAMGIRAMFSQFGLELGGTSLIFLPQTAIAAYAVGLVFTMGAALVPAWRTGRIAPIQALRDDVAMPHSSLTRRMIIGTTLVLAGAAGMAAGLFFDVPRAGWAIGIGMLLVLLGVAGVAPVVTKPFLGAAGWVNARLFGTVGRLAGQNSLRNPRRTTATASALMIGLAVASTLAILGSSTKASVDKAISENFVGDYVVSNAVGQPFSPRIARRIAEVPGVERVAAQRFAFLPMTFGSESQPRDTVAIGIDPDNLDLIGVSFTAGGADAFADGTVIVSEQFAENRGLAVGDTIAAAMLTGEKDLEVAGIYETNPLAGDLMTTTGTLTGGGFPDQDNSLIVIAPDASQDDLDEVVAQLPIVTVANQQEYAEAQRAPIDQMVMLIFALLGLALLIAVLGIVNTLALSVIERTREIGLLRAIGLGRAQLRRMIRLESIVIALLGAALGVALGLLFGTAALWSLRDQGLEVIAIPWGQVGIFLGLALVIGVIAAAFPARRAARLDVLQAIATE